MGASYKRVSDEATQELLRGVGMWGDPNIHGGWRDRWGLYIVELEDYYGYETKSNEQTDQVRRNWSHCTLHDGWDSKVYLQNIQGPEGIRRYFRVEGASFALIEHAYGALNSYVPERLFIYPYSPKFSVRKVAESLREYRKQRPERIFLCPTTQKKLPGKK